MYSMGLVVVLMALCLYGRSVSSLNISMGFRSSVKGAWKRIRGVGGSASSRSDADLKKGIAKFYDESSAIWLDVWGEDMHHGYYPTGKRRDENGLKIDHKEAQIDMIDRSLNWAYGSTATKPVPKSMVDVGCGVGGSSRHITRKYDTITKARGISLSPYQIERAKEFTKAQGLDDKVQYLVDDATKMTFPDDEFDLTWSMESGEHMPDKEVFFGELFRVTAPGGRIIIVTWCHRELAEGETELTPKEKRLLGKINDAYFLPEWVAPSEYHRIAKKLGLEDIRTDDWSDFIAPFWPAVFWSSLVPRNFFRLLRTGKTTIKGAVATLWMLRGFQKGLVKFALITGRKPL